MKRLYWLPVVFCLFVIPAFVLADGSSGYPDVAGVMGIDPPLENSCAAIWVAIPEGQALAGIEWFNNDASVGFPGIYIESGEPDHPLALDETILVATNVTGESSAWSEAVSPPL